MRGPRTPSAVAALAAYADAPRGDRFHVRFRWWTCPFPLVEAEVPRHGSILEVGCGHGLLSIYLALSAPDRTVTGADIDDDKLVLARRAAAAVGATHPEAALVTFVTAAPERFTDGSFDAVVIADVLYLLPPVARLALLDQCIDHLAPGGRLVIKEADRRPRWKAAITVAQELLATKVLRITEGDAVEFTAPDALADHLRSRGLTVEQRRVDRGYLHPHVLILGRREP